MKLHCKKCKNVWDYKGIKKPTKKYTQYTSCPRCHNLVKLKKGGGLMEPYEALAKIKLLLDRFNKNQGKPDDWTNDITNLIDDIEDVLKKAHIPAKHLIVESLENSE